MQIWKAKFGMLLTAVLVIASLVGCSVSANNETKSAVPQTATMGTDFNGNKTPAYAYFGDRTYEQRQFDSSSLRDEHVTSTEAGSYTLMIYLDGSTNLEDPNFVYEGSTLGSMTIDAILASGVDPNRANVVIMTGGSDSWGHPGLEGNGNYVLHVVKDSGGEGLSANVDYHSEEPLNMGDPSTLYSFVDFAAKNYPADHYALMIWNHGRGPLHGCAVDENHNGDSLELPEITQALDATDFGKEKMFDWVGFDCCLMGDLEVANTLSKYSYYMIASQELEVGAGGSFNYGTAWVYSFLNKLNSTSSPVTIAVEAIDQYADGKELVSSDYNTHTTYTMSLMDLTKVSNVKDALDDLFYKLADGLDAGDYSKLAKLREYTKEYGEGGDLDIVDLGYLAWTLEEMYPNESRGLQNAVEELVLYQRTNVPEASGVSLYYPYRNEEQYSKNGGRDLYAKLAVSKGYITYINKFTDILANGEKANDLEVDKPKLEKDDSNNGNKSVADEYGIRLSEEQQKCIARISYNVLTQVNDSDSTDGGSERYRVLLQDCQVAVDADGVVHIPKNQTILTLHSESGEEIVWPFKQVASGASTATYQSLATTIDGPFGAMAWTDSTPVTIIATETLGSGRPDISSISYRNEKDAVEGKSDVDLERYDYLTSWVQPCAPNGNEAEPVWNWKQSDGIVGRGIRIDSKLEIGTITTSELEGNHVLQIVLTDVRGKEYASELYELDSLGVPSQEKAEIDGVNCTFAVYDDHMALTKAEGGTSEFIVPREYQGKPVTQIGGNAFAGTSIKRLVVPDSVEEIGNGAFGSQALERITLPDDLRSIPARAFSGCTNMADITLPQSLQAIGDSAFDGCEKLAVLEIPADVTYIGDGAFQRCSMMRQLTIAEGNKAFKVEKNDDGNVLYTADGTELVACPGLFHSKYSIAKGTKRIRDRAFYGSYSESYSGKSDNSKGHNVVGYGLVRIEFPITLREIGDAAFFECNRLESIDLPENLQIIGMEAFGSTDITGTLGLGSVKFEKDTIDKVAIGKDVRWIGQAAFNSFTIKQFVVDGENEHYSEKDGKLMSKDGKRSIDVYGDKV